MLRDLDDQIQQTKGQPIALTQRLLGLLGEEEYFARQEIEGRRKLAEKRQAKLLAEERERARALHFMKCPKCGMQLEEIAFGNVRIDKCFSCEASGWIRGNLRSSNRKRAASWGEC